MMAHTELGADATFALRQAVLIYESGGAKVFATVHDVLGAEGGPPMLGVGTNVTMDFLGTLAEGLGSRLAPELLPEHVVCRTPHIIAWWTPAHVRVLWYRHDSAAKKLNGRHFPIPALLWRLQGQQLHVRALPTNARPQAATKLLVAPFWNTNEGALVCQGTMTKPESLSGDSLAGWVDGYFGAEFTHAYGNRKLSAHPGGFVEMWESIAGDRDNDLAFPLEWLHDAEQGVAAFLNGARSAGDFDV